MAGKSWKSKEVEALEAEWEKKLKDSGFIDIEKEVNGERVLITPAMCLFERSGAKDIEMTEVVADARRDYYLLLTQHAANEKAYEDNLDRLIMERTAEGRSIEEISKELKGLLEEGKTKSKHSRWAIRFVRRRYENKWGIKTWSPEWMVSRPVKKPRIV